MACSNRRFSSSTVTPIRVVQVTFAALFAVNLLFYLLIPSSISLMLLNSSSAFRNISWVNITTNDSTLWQELMDPDFAPGRIGELCDSEGGGVKRIFFLETSGEKCLRPRQACAVESAALTNPDMTVYVYMTLKPAPGRPEVDKGEGLERHCHTMDLLRSISNVRIVYEEDLLAKHLQGSPLDFLYTEGHLNKSVFALQHASDALRLAMLSRGGGIYLDLDVLVLRSFRCLRNAAGQASDEGKLSVDSDVLVFDPGNKFLELFMQEAAGLYEKDRREAIGPPAFTTFFRSVCNCPQGECLANISDDEASLKDLHFNCRNITSRFTLMNQRAFHPIGWYLQERFYKAHQEPSTLQAELNVLRMHTYSVHVYGSGHGAHIQKGSLFEFLARRFCPAVYSGHVTNVYQF